MVRVLRPRVSGRCLPFRSAVSSPLWTTGHARREPCRRIMLLCLPTAARLLARSRLGTEKASHNVSVVLRFHRLSFIRRAKGISVTPLITAFNLGLVGGGGRQSLVLWVVATEGVNHGMIGPVFIRPRWSYVRFTHLLHFSQTNLIFCLAADPMPHAGRIGYADIAGRS